MSSEGWIGKDWLTSYKVTQTISLLPSTHPGLPEGYAPPKVSFVHGGITPEYAAKGVNYINDIGRSFLYKGLSEPNPSSWLPSNTTAEEQKLWSETGPLWYRGYASDSTPLACENAEKAKTALE